MKILFLSSCLLACALLTGAPAFSQQSKKQTDPSGLKVAMNASAWELNAQGGEFVQHKNVPAMKLAGRERAIIRGLDFRDGTIEYDVEPLAEGFAGIYFHMADNNESEYVYLRTARAGHPAAMDAIQYAPNVKGVLLWDLFYWFQGPANIKKDDWNHIKLVVSGAQMVVYVNDVTTTTLEIPQLEGDTQSGHIAFDGRCIIANVSVKPGVVEGLPARPGFDPTHHDPRYIRRWQVSQPQQLPPGRDLIDKDFPNASTEWLTCSAERRGLVNLSRQFGMSNPRRYVWLRAKINSPAAKNASLTLGFSDDVWVFVNRAPVYVDKNNYVSPSMRKKPDGRISTDNSRIEIPLKEGDNELLIGLANDFYGWGTIARFDDLEGLTLSTDFPKPIAPPSDLTKYTGTYKAEGAPDIIFTSENNILIGSNSGQPGIALEYFEMDKFRYQPGGVVLEFYPNDHKVILKEGGREVTFIKQ